MTFIEGTVSNGAQANQSSDDRRAVFAEAARSPEFRRLRRHVNRFVLIAAVAIETWFLALLVLSAFFPGLMGHQIAGSFTVGLLMALSQVAATLLVAMLFARNSRLSEDGSRAVRTRLEGVS